MRLQNVNPIDTAIGTYGRLQNIDLQKEAGQRARENHATNQKVNQSRLEQIDQQKQDADAERRNKIAMAALGRQILAEENGLEAEYTDEEMEAISQNPLFNVGFLMSDEVGQAVDIGDKVLSNQLSMSSPEAAQALTTLAPELQKGSPGKKAISRPFPGKTKGTLVFDLAVDGVAGKPLTENRSTDENDPIKEVPVEAVVQRQIGVKKMRELLKSEQGRNYLKEVYRQYSGASQKDATTYGDVTQDPVSGLYGQRDSNGQFHVLDARKGKSSSGGSGNPPGDLQVASWLMGEDPTLSRADALKMANQAANNPDKYIQTFIENRMKAQDDPFYSGEKLSLQEVEQMAIDSQRRISERDKVQSSPQNSSGQGSRSFESSSPPIEGAEKAEDGNWYIRKDGKVYRVKQDSSDSQVTDNLEDTKTTEKESKPDQQKTEALDPRVKQIESQVEKLQNELDSIKEQSGNKDSQDMYSALKNDREYNSAENAKKRKAIRDQKKKLKKQIKELNDIKEQLASLNEDSETGDTREDFRNKRRRERLAQTASKYGIDISTVQNIANN